MLNHTIGHITSSNLDPTRNLIMIFNWLLTWVLLIVLLLLSFLPILLTVLLRVSVWCSGRMVWTFLHHCSCLIGCCIALCKSLFALKGSLLGWWSTCCLLISACWWLYYSNYFFLDSENALWISHLPCTTSLCSVWVLLWSVLHIFYLDTPWCVIFHLLYFHLLTFSRTFSFSCKSYCLFMHFFFIELYLMVLPLIWSFTVSHNNWWLASLLIGNVSVITSLTRLT